MSIGLRTIYNVIADVAYAASTVFTTVGLTSPIAKNQTQKLRAWVPFSVGATGGLKFQLLVPAGGVAFILSATTNNTVAPSVTVITQTGSASAGLAVANAGTHWMLIEATIINGSTAGDIDLQFAQNSAANTSTILKGAIMEVVKL